MRIPHTVPRNVHEAYKCSSESSRLPNERGRGIRAEDVSWDEDVVPELRILALRAVANTWQDNPLLEELPTCIDRVFLLETLPTTLPFELLIAGIADEHYWERCAKDRWQCNDPEEHGNSWRRLYCERHLCEYLENLEASYFESQKEGCEKVIKLVRDYVHTIKLRSLLPTKKSANWKEDEDADPCTTEEDIVHHIPMATILPHFPNLSEIYLHFGVIYMNDGFEWRDFKFSVEDCVNLGEGIKSCLKLRKFALTRSNLDQPRAAAILQGMATNGSVEEVDFSHCKLGDNGAHAVGEFLSVSPNLRTLHLTNNNVGSNGIAGIIHGLLKRDTATLRHLNLRLNPFEDPGVAHICALLLRNDSLETLNISGCGLGVEGGTALADVLSSGCVKVPSLSLDMSNNDFGPVVGEAFENVLKTSPYIISLDARMCNFSKESEYSISERVLRNKEGKKKEKANKVLFDQEASMYTPTAAKSLQQQPEANSTSAWRKDIPNRATATQIDAGDVGIMKSILKFRNTASGSGRGKLKAPFGRTADHQDKTAVYRGSTQH